MSSDENPHLTDVAAGMEYSSLAQPGGSGLRVQSQADEPVRACICFPHSFAEVKSVAEALGLTSVEQIEQALGCGGGCGQCRPYLAKVLATGKTAFAVIPS